MPMSMLILSESFVLIKAFGCRKREGGRDPAGRQKPLEMVDTSPRL